MTREDKDSIVEMLAKIPVTETKGSLLSAISKLLRVIDISESSIMIPTLLKDKCEFDAYEMLTLAKILKASILGHNDLVEFYMSESSSQSQLCTTTFAQQQQNRQQQNQQQQNRQQVSAMLSLRSSVSSDSNTNSTLSSTVSTPISSTTHTTGCSSSSNFTRLHPDSHHTDHHDHHHNHLHHHTSHNHHQSSHHNHHQCQNDQYQLLLRQQINNNGNPDATFSLLLQIEQLKIFIPQVTSIFESIIELYKNSVADV